MAKEGNAQAAAPPARAAGACDGDVEALYRDHRLPVLKLAYVLSGSWQVAEEVTQESFLRLLDRERGPIVNPAGWVRTVAANLARSRVRRLSAEVRAIARLGAQRSDPATLDTASVEAEAFWAQVRTLPALWTLGSDDQAWVQAASPAIDPPFRATSGDGALLVVTADRLHTLTAVDADVVQDEPSEDLLGLSATAQEQRAGVAAITVDDGDPGIDTISTVLIGEAGTRVTTVSATLHWRMEQGPPTARFLDAVHVADERRVVVVDGVASGHLELLDVAWGGWQPLDTPPHDQGHSPATAAGNGMLFTWGGGSSSNLPHDQGALLILQPASPVTWPPGRAPQPLESFASTPVALGLPDDLDPDPGPLPPLIAPGGVWSVRTTVDGTAVLAQTPYDSSPSGAVRLPGPPLTGLA
ncbi:MAG TPA: sigma factor, partial [Euzebya sp.]|nr:sigma factor [Euzebya sp.]